jgi:hypothetical protein
MAKDIFRGKSENGSKSPDYFPVSRVLDGKAGFGQPGYKSRWFSVARGLIQREMIMQRHILKRGF